MLNRGFQRNMLEGIQRNTIAHNLGPDGPRDKSGGLLQRGERETTGKRMTSKH